MSPSEACYAIIKTHEGLRLHAYPDPATGAYPWTIGYGHTKDVVAGQEITQAEADEFLREDVETFAYGVMGAVTHSPTQPQFDAMVSLSFNIGLRNFQNSTLLRDFNMGKILDAADQFLVWNKAAGKVMPGLIIRRESERELFLS